MFDLLSDRLEKVFRSIRGAGRLSESQVDESLRRLRVALLEADVHVRVVGDLLARVRERAVGREVAKALTPGQQVIKVVYEELVAILGRTTVPLELAERPPTVVMLAGLQGAGKTTAAAKLAAWLKAGGRRPILVACDLRRAAAVRQLEILADRVDVPIIADPNGSAIEIATSGRAEAESRGRDVVIVDTAGRLHIDDEMMTEAEAVRDRIRPDEILLVLDAMTGQDAVTVATAFAERLDYTGMVLTKLDGDARGGAALSVAHVCGRPVKFMSAGEQMDAFEQFHPDRMASRILGMGDALTLIERAEAAFAEEKRRSMEKRLRTNSLTLDDFLEQMRGLRRMGPLSSVLGMIPGLGAQLKGLEVGEKDLSRAEAIICSMTAAERAEPRTVDGSRKARIARGSGTSTVDVNMVLRQFDQARALMRAVAGSGVLPSGLDAPAGPGSARVHRSGPARPRPRSAKRHAKGKKRRR